MIESFVPGRVRLRSRLFEDAEAAELLRGGLLEIRGVRSAEVNERTGRLLLEYDTRRLPIPLLSRALPLFERFRELEAEAAGERLPAMLSILRELKVLLEGGG